MHNPILNILLEGISIGDAISRQALRQRQWLREEGVTCDIYATHIDARLIGDVRPIAQYAPQRGETHVIFHHSIASQIVPRLLKTSLKVIMVYHNVTPAKFFAHLDNNWARLTEEGVAQTRALRPQLAFIFADSAYNGQFVAEYADIVVLPICVDSAEFEQPDNPTLAAQLAQVPSNLLFVGRLAPNKCQIDLVKLLAAVRRIRPKTHLHLVGDHWQIGYDRRVEMFASELGLSRAVHLPNKVSRQDLLTYYRNCDLYVSMSEHEGFGKPLIESMMCDLPILAYGCEGVVDTMGGCGVLFYEKRYAELAEVVDILLNDTQLRMRQLAKQRDYKVQFQAGRVRNTFFEALRKHRGLPEGVGNG